MIISEPKSIHLNGYNTKLRLMLSQVSEHQPVFFPYTPYRYIMHSKDLPLGKALN